jgi:N-acetylglucosamine-6-sulfatase
MLDADYLAFKAPHNPFQPAAGHQGRYIGKPIPFPDTMARTEDNYRTQPRWVHEPHSCHEYTRFHRR